MYYPYIAKIFIALLLLLPSSSYAQKKPRVIAERFDDWFYRCVSSEKAKKQECEVVQIAQTQHKGKTINLLTISVTQKVEKKKKNIIITMLTPLNTFLPKGVQLRVDKGKKINLKYRNCNKAGCWIQHLIASKTLKSFQRGNYGYGQIRLMNGQNINIRFSLKGFGKALKALQSGKKPNVKS